MSTSSWNQPRPNPTTVEETIASLLDEAVKKLRDGAPDVERRQVDRICTGLAALRPFIPISVVSKISGVDEGGIKSFAIDLGRPLHVVGDAIQFLDEPAETWFRERFKPTTDAVAEFIKVLMPLASGSTYVATVLPQLMLDAGQLPELVELALQSAALPEASPLERHQVELQRLQFALKAGLRSKRYLDVTKLALKAGGETAGDDRQRRLIQSNTDLAALFLDGETIQEMVTRKTMRSKWLGSHHAYEASLLSGQTELVGDARSRLRIAYEWLRNWSRLPSKDREKERVSEQDIAELILAHVNIHDPGAAARNLRVWTPREVSFRVGRIVARRLIDRDRIQCLEELACEAGNNLFLMLAISVELREIQCILPHEVNRRAFRLIADTRVNLKLGRDWDNEESTLNAVIALVEACLEQAVCTNDEAVEVLTRYLPSGPPSIVSFRYSKSRLPLIRAYCLHAALQGKELEVRDLAPEKYRAEMDRQGQNSDSGDLRKFQAEVGALLPWHKLAAESSLGLVTKITLTDKLVRSIEISRKAGNSYYYDEHLRESDEISLLWIEVLLKLDAADSTALAEFMKWKNDLKQPLAVSTLTALARLCGRNNSTKAHAIQFADEAFSLLKDARSNAETESEGYIEVARAILPVSQADAQAYFNEAFEIATRIGDENLWRWDSLLDLADHTASSHCHRPELAYVFARCAELTYRYVERDKHFDWHSTVEALCGLCPSSTFALLSRWRDRKFGLSERILPIAINRLIEQGSLDARDATPLVGFLAEWEYHSLLDHVLKACVNDEEKRIAFTYMYRYIRLAGGTLAKLKNVAAKHGISLAELDEAIAFDERKITRVGDTLGVKSPESHNWDDLFLSCDLTKADGLSRAYAALKLTNPRWDYEEFFKQIIERAPVGMEKEFIIAVGNTPALDLLDFKALLEQVPPQWKNRPATKAALEATLRSFCRRCCMEIKRNRGYQFLPLKLATTATGVREVEIVDTVLDAVGEATGLAASDRLFSLVGLLVVKLSADEAQEALRYGLGLFSSVLDPRDGDGPWSTTLLPPSEIRASIAGYVWASLASPEGVVRWEGSHVVLGLIALSREDVLRFLMGFAEEGKGGPFIDASLPFYKLHALQWFLIGIARAAPDFPRMLAPFGNQIVDWALRGQPHVLIRQFAAHAAIALLNHGALADEDGLKVRLAGVNLSPFPFVESKSFNRYPPREEETEIASDDEDDRYFFDIDIGPYWFAPLGRIFAKTENEIKRRALKIIRSEFGFSAKRRSDEDARHTRNLYEEDHTMHSHGSHPRADTHSFYHAYHAMMIVAGNLLATEPTHRDTEYGQQYEFAEWLDTHSLSRKDWLWLWDRRDPTPLEWPSWLASKGDNHALTAITTNDFDEAINLAGGLVNVWGHWTATDIAREQEVYICSVFVNSEKSESLLRALATALDVHDYAIPSVGSEKEIDACGFSLKGWITDDYSSHGIDDQDRWAGDISFPPPIPASFVVEAMELESDFDYRNWKSKDNQLVISSEVWGHFDELKRHKPGNPERGSRLKTSLGFLTAMLAKLGCDLIIKVQIDRKKRSPSYRSTLEDNNDRMPPKARLYLLRVDGTISALGADE